MTDNDTAVPLDDLNNWLELYRQATDGIAALEERRKVARERIEAALGEAETGTVAGRPVVRWTHVTSTRLDQRKAKALLDGYGALDEAMTETTSRRFVLVTEEES